MSLFFVRQTFLYILAWASDSRASRPAHAAVMVWEYAVHGVKFSQAQVAAPFWPCTASIARHEKPTPLQVSVSQDGSVSVDSKGAQHAHVVKPKAAPSFHEEQEQDEENDDEHHEDAAWLQGEQACMHTYKQNDRYVHVYCMMLRICYEEVKKRQSRISPKYSWAVCVSHLVISSRSWKMSSSWPAIRKVRR